MVVVVQWSACSPSSNPAEAFTFFCKIVFRKNEKKQKRGQGWPTLKNTTNDVGQAQDASVLGNK